MASLDKQSCAEKEQSYRHIQSPAFDHAQAGSHIVTAGAGESCSVDGKDAPCDADHAQYQGEDLDQDEDGQWLGRGVVGHTQILALSGRAFAYY